MSVKVKICGITSVPDALAAVEAGAHAIGLMLWEGSPRYVTLAQAAEIARVVPPHVLRTGVFVDPPEQWVFQTMTACGLTLLQFHGQETSEFCRRFGLMSMKAFRIRDAASLSKLADYPTDAWLLDACTPGKLGGSGECFNWDLAVEATKMGRPIFLAGGLHPGNVAAAIRQVRPFGVDVSSGVESAPGKKDLEKMREFLRAVREADAEAF